MQTDPIAAGHAVAVLREQLGLSAVQAAQLWELSGGSIEAGLELFCQDPQMFGAPQSLLLHADMPAPAPAPAPSVEEEMISWPPLLLLEGLDDSGNSRSRLFQLFGQNFSPSLSEPACPSIGPTGASQASSPSLWTARKAR